MSRTMQLFYQNGILPVVVIDDADKAVPLAQALLRGGISTIEITLRTDAGIKSIERIHREVPQMHVGAGTVISCEKAEQAVQAGAQFIISPGLNLPVIQWCREREIPVFPGVATPSEVESALNLGLSELKFFPAEAAGGVSMLRSFASPYSMVQFLPTGGIGLENMLDYQSLPNVCACGGSWLCPSSLIEQEEFDRIEQLAREAITKLHGFSIREIGFCCKTVMEWEKLEALSSFSNFQFSRYKGEKTYIKITVNDVGRAKAFLEYRGFSFPADQNRTEMTDFTLCLEQKI